MPDTWRWKRGRVGARKGRPCVKLGGSSEVTHVYLWVCVSSCFFLSLFTLSFLVIMFIWGSERQEHDLPGRFRGGGRPQTRPLRSPYGPSPRGLTHRAIGVVGPLFNADGQLANEERQVFASHLNRRVSPNVAFLLRLGPFPLGVLGRAISIHVAVFPNQVSDKCPNKHLRSSPLPLDSQMMSTVGCANPT